MASILDVVGSVLQTAGVGTLGTTLFLSRSPASPDACVTVLETGSGAPTYTFRSSGAALTTTNVQVVARAALEDYPAARTKIESAVAAMEAVNDISVSGTRLLRAELVGQPTPLGPDGNERPRIAATFAVLHD